jgi:hypothetical protein
MKTFLTFFFFIPFLLYGQVAWSPPKTVNGLTVNNNDIFVSYTDNNGNHLLINSSGTIRYVLLDKTGGEVLYERTIDNNCEYSDYTIALAAYQNELYIVYQKGTKIKVSKSIDAGNSWSFLTEKEMNSSNCSGIDAVYDDLGLHLVWAVNSQVYYERYRRENPDWEANKHITEGSGGVRPTIVLSENKIHVGCFIEGTYLITRDFNFNINEWESLQFPSYQTPPPPYPDWQVIEYDTHEAVKISYNNGYLHLMTYMRVQANDGFFDYNFLYLFDKQRPVNSNVWETEKLITKYLYRATWGPGELMPMPISINSVEKLHTLAYEYDPDLLIVLEISYYNFSSDNWNGPMKIISASGLYLRYFSLTASKETIFAYWIIFGSNELHYSYALQYPSTPLEIDPISRFLNRQHYFFEYEPEVFLSLKIKP